MRAAVGRRDRGDGGRYGKRLVVKILCLIIDATPQISWQETYAVHREIWHRCLDRRPDVDGYFIYSDPTIASDYVVEARRFVARFSEQHGTILFKTTCAIEVLLADHDYVVRTNISSLYDFPLLSRQDLPAAGLYSGHLVDGKYVTGSGMILSRDVAQMLTAPVDPQVCHQSDGWDDAAIGQILRSRGVDPQHRDAFIYDYAKGLDQLSVGKHLHYRLRQYVDPAREHERVVTAHVFSKIYEEA